MKQIRVTHHGDHTGQVHSLPSGRGIRGLGVARAGSRKQDQRGDDKDLSVSTFDMLDKLKNSRYRYRCWLSRSSATAAEVSNEEEEDCRSDETHFQVSVIAVLLHPVLQTNGGPSLDEAWPGEQQPREASRPQPGCMCESCSADRSRQHQVRSRSRSRENDAGVARYPSDGYNQPSSMRVSLPRASKYFGPPSSSSQLHCSSPLERHTWMRRNADLARPAPRPDSRRTALKPANTWTTFRCKSVVSIPIQMSGLITLKVSISASPRTCSRFSRTVNRG